MKSELSGHKCFLFIGSGDETWPSQGLCAQRFTAPPGLARGGGVGQAAAGGAAQRSAKRGLDAKAVGRQRVLKGMTLPFLL